MTKNGVLKVAMVTGADIAVNNWSVSDQVVASAVLGMVQNVPAETMVTFTVNGNAEMRVDMSGCIVLTTVIKCHCKMFSFLANVGEQTAYDMYQVMSAIMTRYLDSTVRPAVLL